MKFPGFAFPRTGERPAPLGADSTRTRVHAARTAAGSAPGAGDSDTGNKTQGHSLEQVWQTAGSRDLVAEGIRRLQKLYSELAL